MNLPIGMSECENLFCDAMLKLHNDYRVKHRVANLTEDHQLSMQADMYAHTLAESGKLVKSQSGGLYGESLVTRSYKEAPTMTKSVCYGNSQLMKNL